MNHFWRVKLNPFLNVSVQFFSSRYFNNYAFIQVPSRAEEITIPADVTPEKVPTHIVDFSSKF